MSWKREVFWTHLLPIFSWSTFQRLRVIWKKIPKTQGGCSPWIHLFTVSGERCVHRLRRQWGGHPTGGAGTGRWAGHFSGIRDAVGKGCWTMQGLCRGGGVFVLRRMLQRKFCWDLKVPWSGPRGEDTRETLPEAGRKPGCVATLQAEMQTPTLPWPLGAQWQLQSPKEKLESRRTWFLWFLSALQFSESTTLCFKSSC